MSEVLFPHIIEEGTLPELELGLAGLTLRGTSVAARATAFAVSELGVTLDLGRLSPTIAAQPVVLLSHGHLDHLSGVLAYLNVRARFHPEPPPRLFVPRAVAEPLQQALAVMPGMESVRKRLKLEQVIVPVAAGDVVAIPGGEAAAFALDHGVPALGWSLRRPGGSRSALVYAADGSTEPFQTSPALLNAEVAIVECTFVERNRRIAARLARHAHVLDWVELAPTLRCAWLVLAHLPPLPKAELVALTAPLADVMSARLVLWSV
jgi:ribonuclease BN (tRNA processing enzyme)